MPGVATMFFYACEESSNYAPKISEQDIALNLVAEKKNTWILFASFDWNLQTT